MRWNYRIVRYADGCLALHEVYYDDRSGAPMCRTDERTDFIVCPDEGVMGLIGRMTKALDDAVNRSILDDRDIGKATTAV